MSTARDAWTEVGGLAIHYLTAGRGGSPVVLLHGGGLDSASLTYGDILGPLSRNHSVFAPDLPGYGESDKPDLEYTMQFYISFVGSFMQAIGIRSAALAGLSLGGGAALGFALRAPQSVSKLVLIDSYGLGGEIPWPLVTNLMIRLPFVNEATWLLTSRSQALIWRSLRAILGRPDAATPELVEEVCRIAHKKGTGKAFQYFQRSELTSSGLRTNFAPRLSDLKMPVLIIHGAEDRLVPVAWAERAHRHVKTSQLVVIPGCGHWPPREKPEEFQEAMLGFLGNSTPKLTS